MIRRRVPFGSIVSKVVPLDGGLNENVSSLEMKGGELVASLNYEMREGSQGGYSSISGYERFDGNTKPSSVYADETSETDREAARAAITEVPGEGNVLGVHIFKGKVYAFRNKVGGATAGMYVESPTGWVEIDTTANPLLPGGTNYNFSVYNFKSTISTLAMYWCDGINTAMAFDGTTVTKIPNVGMGSNDNPINIVAHNSRLFLAYSLGSLQASTLGDPTDWTTSPTELGIGREITSLVSGVGNSLVIFCDNSTKVLNGSEDSSSWELITHSTNSGAYKSTPQRLFGTIFFMDDRGVTFMESVQEYGDFATASISQKIYKTIQENKNLVTCSTVSRDKNQYRMFTNNNIGAFFSFVNKKLRGVTLVQYNIPVLSVVEGEDSLGNNLIYFTSNDGYVYQMDSGTSFDGEVINTKMTTAYYHYGSPRALKRFISLTAEVYSLSDLTLGIRTLFDYSDGNSPRGGITDIQLQGIGDLYGEGVWGTAVYSSAGVTSRLRHYIKGIGTNMGVSLSTSSKFNKQHVIQNLIVDYETTRRQL